MQQELNGEPVEILNPNHLSEDGTAALVNQSYSRDGALMAYGISRHGSDWQEIRVRRIDAVEDYTESYSGANSLAWPGRTTRRFFL